MDDEDGPEEQFSAEEDVLADDRLHLPNHEKDRLAYEFKYFDFKKDMNNPVFQVGMCFPDVRELRDALTAYSARERVVLRKVRNNKRSLEVICAPGCPGILKADIDNKMGGFVIKGYGSLHTCPRVWEMRSLTPSYMSKKFADEFGANSDMPICAFTKNVTKEFNICPPR